MMALVDFGGLGVLGQGDPLRMAWWWSHVVQIWTHIKRIKEAAAYDPDKETAPKNIWLDEKEIKIWFDYREQLRDDRARGLD